MIYAQLKILSTGYIDGTVPPKFDEHCKQPIDMCGSDSIIRLDARKNILNLKQDVCTFVSKRCNKNSIIGFDIIKASDYSGRNVKVLASFSINQQIN